MCKKSHYARRSTRAAAALLTIGASTAGAEIRFEDVSASAGITDTGESYGTGFLDTNGDGYPEIFGDKHQFLPSVLYQNQPGPAGSRVFQDVASEVLGGIFDVHTDSHSMASADWDNDGDPDIMEVTGAGWTFPLWLNDGAGQFINLGGQLGFVYPPTWSRRGSMPTGGRAPLFFDYTGDGKLDVLVVTRDNFPAYRQPSATFRQDTSPDGLPLFVLDESTGVDLINDVACHYALLAELTGDGVQDVICADSSEVTRVWDITQMPFRELRPVIGDALYTSFPLDLAAGDFDGDLRTDLFAPYGASSTNLVGAVDSKTVHAWLDKNVAFDSGFAFTADGDVTFEFDWWTKTQEIYLGSAGQHPAGSTQLPTLPGQLPGSMPRHIKFTLTAAQAQGLAPRSTDIPRGIFIGVVDGQWQVRLTGTYDWEVGMVIRAATSLSELSAIGPVRVGQPTTGSPLLLLQNQDHQLVNSSSQIQSVNRSCNSAAAGDLDNDMDLDLYVGCTGELSNLPNVVYENQGNGTFVPVPQAGGAEGQMPEGRLDTVTMGDYDLDGKLDVFLANGFLFRPFSYAGKQQLFRNTGATGNHWIQFDLEGTISNRDGIGAILYATTPDGKVQLREQGNGMHKKAQNFKRIHYGLAGNTRVNLEVRWPSGTVDTFTGLPADQVHHLVEGTGSNRPFSVTVTDPSMAETAGAAEFAVTLSPAPGPGEAVAVAYQTADGTALAGGDYTATSGTLTFGPGETVKSISVPVIDDAVTEGDETFDLTLTGAQTGEITATATIRDNDTAVTPPACGAPNPAYNKATETAVFLWNDCGTNQWHLRGTGGGRVVRFAGSLTASPAFARLSGFSVEATDRLPPNFVMNVSGKWQDGIDFSLPAGGQACFNVTAPVAATVIAGSDRVPLTSAVSLPGFGPCPE